jgi:enediyne biosynthesis protein E4
MAVAVADFDQDRFRDLFVTNDKMPNFLFHNLGDGKFEEAALETGGALLDSVLVLKDVPTNQVLPVRE